MASSFALIVLLGLTAALWSAADALPPGGCSTCPPGWTWFGRRCYLFQNPEKDWADAERFCNSLNGNLASIHSREEYVFIRGLIFKAVKIHKQSWVGGHDEVKEGVWLWSDGSVFNFNSWGRGQPDNYKGREDCLEINFGGKDFNDGTCSTKKSFVCATDR
ncbi:galactose-specific lectin nattectin-like [Embiotoca jacksoni]|uniref:galactose-specific lectin nattectin-like n=1 Tax=Embiotoca jacksoni TaxID=100190 RepID=UPI0037039993